MSPTVDNDLSSLIQSAFTSNAKQLAVDIPSAPARASYDDLTCTYDQFISTLAIADDELIVLQGAKTITTYSLIAGCFRNARSICSLDETLPAAAVMDICCQLRQGILVTDHLPDPPRDDAFQIQEIGRHGPLSAYRYSIDFGLSPSPSPSPEAHYYIATSGSTGHSKIVQVPHNSIVRYILDTAETLDIEHPVRWAQFSSHAFDLFIEDMLITFVLGGTLVVPTTLGEKSRLGDFIDDNKITHWNSVPTMIPSILRSHSGTPNLSSIVYFTFCGEPLLVQPCKRLADHAPLSTIINSYCPTETALYCSNYRVRRSDLDTPPHHTIPIGSPIPGTNFLYMPDDDGLRCYILDSNIGSRYVGQQSDSFGKLRFLKQEISFFDTGDYFLQLGGHYYFSHRVDAMVKIHGNRIDLDSIVNTANTFINGDACALTDNGKITLFVEEKDAAASPDSAILLYLSQRLPAYSVPSQILRVENFPRTTSSKIDKRALLMILRGQDKINE